MKKVTTLFLAMAICTFSYGQEDQKMEKEKAAILEVIDQEAKRFVNLDMEGLTALHVQSESDVRLSGTQLHSGWEDIHQLLEAYMERNKQDPGHKDSWNEKENLKMKIMGNAAWVICDNIWNWKMEEETMVFRNYQISFLEKIDLTVGQSIFFHLFGYQMFYGYLFFFKFRVPRQLNQFHPID